MVIANPERNEIKGDRKTDWKKVESVSNATDRPNLAGCRYCSKTGHTERQCFKKQRIKGQGF